MSKRRRQKNFAPKTVVVTPPTSTKTAAQTQQFAAAVNTPRGSAIASNHNSAKGVWSTSDATKATVNQSGLATAVATGSAVITFTAWNGVKHQATLTIS